jgi:hypothetical protein
MNMNVYTNTNMNEMRGIIKGWGGGGGATHFHLSQKKRIATLNRMGIKHKQNHHHKTLVVVLMCIQNLGFMEP